MDNIIIWAAGFMDGEGTFTLKRVRRKGRIYHQPYVSCAQVEKGSQAIYKLQELFGGNIFKYRQKGFRSDTLQWTVASRQAQNCVKILLPHLMLKAKQAQIILDFYSIILEREKQYRLSEKDYENRDKLWQKMRALNVKGKLRLQRLSEKTAEADAIV